jgi:hypothetical protein
MSHHGSDPFGSPEARKSFEQLNKLKEDLLNTASFRGALGDFPEGQLTKSDEGAVQFAVGVKDGKVVLDFGTPVAWVGMNPQQAADLASSILKHARIAGRAAGQTVGFTIG